jgi:hypothetical protein
MDLPEELPDLVEELYKPRTSQMVQVERGPHNNPWATALVELEVAQEMIEAGWRLSPTT